ncbi:hypothetical protein [Streptomyces sp. KL116D]|uniref:hypothetical protein n=1 Tax=Streptomyces sp. KL116D TaxID=3045152 RepID=UPI0035582D94
MTINGSVRVEADWFQGNATQNFWRSAENMSVSPTGGTDRWAVSQGRPVPAHARARRPRALDGWRLVGGGSSRCAGRRPDPLTLQQQFLTRNSQMGGWSGSSWNMVFVGDQGAPPILPRTQRREHPRRSARGRSSTSTGAGAA